MCPTHPPTIGSAGQPRKSAWCTARRYLRAAAERSTPLAATGPPASTSGWAPTPGRQTCCTTCKSACISPACWKATAHRPGPPTCSTPPRSAAPRRWGETTWGGSPPPPSHISPPDVAHAPRRGGPRARGRDDLGPLSAAALADIVVFDLKGTPLGPFSEPLKNLILAGRGSDCRASYIGGRCVMEDFQVGATDSAALQAQADRQF